MTKKRHILYTAGMSLLALLFCLPFLPVLVFSLSGDAGGVQPALTFSHFTRAWQAMHFESALLNTALITCASAAGIVLLALLAAYGLQRSGLCASRLLYPFFVFCLLVPLPSLLLPLVRIAALLGLNNAAGIVFIYWGLGSPLAVVIFHTFLKGLPTDCEDAAALDGAGFFRTLFAIVLPEIKPVIVTVVILTVFRTANDFSLPLVLGLRTLVQPAQFEFFIQARGSWGPASAALVLTAMPVVVFFQAVRKQALTSIPAKVIKP